MTSGTASADISCHLALRVVSTSGSANPGITVFESTSPLNAPLSVFRPQDGAYLKVHRECPVLRATRRASGRCNAQRLATVSGFLHFTQSPLLGILRGYVRSPNVVVLSQSAPDCSTNNPLRPDQSKDNATASTGSKRGRRALATLRYPSPSAVLTYCNGPCGL